MKYLIYISLILFLLTSCKKLILGADEANTPMNNFDLLWKDFDKRYALFEAKNIDWDDLYKVYRGQINTSTNDEQLWNIMSDLLEHLNDSHVSLFNSDESKYFTSGFTFNEQSKKEFNYELISDNYLNSRIEVEGETDFSYGKIKNKDIGYIYLGSQNGKDPGKIDDVLSSLKIHAAIIVDVRQNTGGDDRYSARIAGAFADKEKVIYSVQARNGPEYNDFDEKTFYSTKKQGSQQFLKPVILLTDRRTISAGEIFCLHMKAFNHVTQIGDTTAGDFATTGNRGFLPNGWNYKVPVLLFLRANGEFLDGNGGNAPDIYIKNTEANILANEDAVLQEAIDFLFNKYGIE